MSKIERIAIQFFSLMLLGAIIRISFLTTIQWLPLLYIYGYIAVVVVYLLSRAEKITSMLQGTSRNDNAALAKKIAWHIRVAAASVPFFGLWWTPKLATAIEARFTESMPEK